MNPYADLYALNLDILRDRLRTEGFRLSVEEAEGFAAQMVRLAKQAREWDADGKPAPV